jgi:hypothetical protein
LGQLIIFSAAQQPGRFVARNKPMLASLCKPCDIAGKTNLKKVGRK